MIIEQKLSPEEFKKVGFIPGYIRLCASDCMKLNEILYFELKDLKQFSQEWFKKAKKIHNKPKFYLKQYKYKIFEE